MKSVVTMSVLLFGLLLLGGCNPVRPLPAGSDEPAATATAAAEAEAASQAGSPGDSQGAAANMVGVLANHWASTAVRSQSPAARPSNGPMPAWE